jgi:pantoate--beta-alanine ligase
MSSRNARLSPEGRAAAAVLRRALLAGSAAITGGERSGDAVRATMRDVLATEPRAESDYVSVADADTLAETASIEGEVLLSLAVRIDGVRLIDNERA